MRFLLLSHRVELCLKLISLRVKMKGPEDHMTIIPCYLYIYTHRKV
jgi:hypothetical protein